MINWGKIYHEYYMTEIITLSIKYIILFIGKFDFVFNHTELYCQDERVESDTGHYWSV